jgi:UDP-N-acetylglucosamine 2-epimerase (non-hydrolysing)
VIALVYGTTGELIKIAPVMKRLERDGIPFLTLTTAQQADQLPSALLEFGLRQADFELGRGASGHDLRARRDLPIWFATVCVRFARYYRSVRRRVVEGPGDPLILVHGDTMTALLGALMGKLLRFPVAHLEAGLRSGDLRNPFPEELHRRLVTRLADIHFAPNPSAAQNLGTHSGKIVETHGNTVIDSLELVSTDGVLVNVPRPYGIVSIHRSELIDDADAFPALVHFLREKSRSQRMVLVNHSVTDQRLRDYGLIDCFDDQFLLLPKQTYFSFVRLLKRSAFVITDSGGLQEECAGLGIPCATHRVVSERPDGIGANVVLTGGDLAALAAFLTNPSEFRRARIARVHSPSDEVVANLIGDGFALPATSS